MRNVWAHIAAFFIAHRLKTSPDPPLDFSRLVNSPQRWLLIMPAETHAFEEALSQLKDFLLTLSGVRFYLLLPGFLQDRVQPTPDLKVIPYDRQDLFFRRFPRRVLLKKLQRIHPAVVLDLCPRPTPFSLAASGLCGARFRGALSRIQGDGIFNLLIKSRAGDLGERYRALFAYLS
jgi:hypothetical protein